MRRVSEKQKERNKKKADETLLLHKLFKEIWDQREDEQGSCYCFETGKELPGYAFRGLSTCYDHVLEKGSGSFPEYSFCKANIIIIHPDVHQQKGRDLDKVPKIKAYREFLLSLHREGKLKDYE